MMSRARANNEPLPFLLSWGNWGNLNDGERTVAQWRFMALSVEVYTLEQSARMFFLFSTNTGRKTAMQPDFNITVLSSRS